MVLALAAGTKSGGGDYKATPLASSSTWEAGGSSGTFTWSYPLRVPPSAAGPKPELSISYDSGAVDGRTASTNNQGTVIGEGFDITSSYIERKYGVCDDDGQTDKFDLCWKYDNASLVLNGKASELVKDDTSGTWRLKNDDASTVTVATGADNGEHWTITTGEGIKYVFGLNKLDGAAATDRTNSVWTVPVFGDDAGEPGYADGSAFADRYKEKQAWRWNLDYVEDTLGNAMSYWYTAEVNHYDMLGDDTNGTAYIRGGYLNEIRYGQRSGALFSAAPAASNKVVFGYAERCETDCGSLTDATRDNWPDVPFDSECKADQKCTGSVSPTFYTRKRMTGIATQAWDRVHPRLTHRSSWLDHDGELPLVEGTLIRLKVEHLSKERDAPPVWLWSSKTGATPDDVDRFWQAFLRRFDLEHTFRFAKQTLGWTTPKLRNPQAADRWTWILIVAHTQLRLARPLAEDLRRPWEKPATPDRLTPARVRRGFRNIRAHLACPTRVPKPREAGPGRPPGAKNRHRAPRYDVGNTVKRPKTLKATGRPGRSW